MIRQIIEVSSFDGIVEVYLQDLGSTRNLLLAHQGDGQELLPNIAFSSWSLVKIPLMVTAFRYMDAPYPAGSDRIDGRDDPTIRKRQHGHIGHAWSSIVTSLP
jgi:hypothetical protein